MYTTTLCTYRHGHTFIEVEKARGGLDKYQVTLAKLYKTGEFRKGNGLATYITGTFQELDHAFNSGTNRVHISSNNEAYQLVDAQKEIRMTVMKRLRELSADTNVSAEGQDVSGAYVQLDEQNNKGDE